jgi:catechol 2,3-dioxygenase-like lactoylglutathione lyase family enzyme
MPIPDGAEAARPFLPTEDFDKSKAFYEALGFEKLLDSDVAIFRIGQTSFILQRHHNEAGNDHMMQLMVDDLDAWWAHIERLDLKARFGELMLRPPAMQPWGLRVAYVSDPAGVLWHIAQRRPGKPQD